MEKHYGEKPKVIDIMMKGLVASYVTSPQRMDMIHNYILSKEGHTAIKDYHTFPEKSKAPGELLPRVPHAINLPEGNPEFNPGKHWKEKLKKLHSQKTTAFQNNVLQKKGDSGNT